MDSNGFESVELAIDRIDAVVRGMIDRDSPEMRAIRDSIAELSRKLGSEQYASISLRLTISDRIQARVLPIDILTFTSDRGEEAYDATEECSPQQYRVQEVECVVPHDRCPRCWEGWTHKFQNTECPNCRLRLGTDCTVIVKDDQCPQCEDGIISTDTPVCGECGFALDPEYVEWQQIPPSIDSHRGSPQ
jgi:hypothetical protein